MSDFTTSGGWNGQIEEFRRSGGGGGSGYNYAGLGLPASSHPNIGLIKG